MMSSRPFGKEYRSSFFVHHGSINSRNRDSVVHRLRRRRLNFENVPLFELHPFSYARKVPVSSRECSNGCKRSCTSLRMPWVNRLRTVEIKLFREQCRWRAYCSTQSSTLPCGTDFLLHLHYLWSARDCVHHREGSALDSQSGWHSRRTNVPTDCFLSLATSTQPQRTQAERWTRFTCRTHLIPSVFEAINGERRELEVFGTEYPMPDGTCITFTSMIWPNIWSREVQPR
jgi:hypothetical protein